MNDIFQLPSTISVTPLQDETFSGVRGRRAGQRAGPPSTSAWAVIWSGELENIQAHGMAVGFLLDEDFSESSLRHEFVTISSRREGGIDCCNVSLFQLSLLSQEVGSMFADREIKQTLRRIFFETPWRYPPTFFRDRFPIYVIIFFKGIPNRQFWVRR